MIDCITRYCASVCEDLIATSVAGSLSLNATSKGYLANEACTFAIVLTNKWFRLVCSLVTDPKSFSVSVIISLY